MIVTSWLIFETPDSPDDYVAREHRGGMDGMGRPVDEFTGMEINGELNDLQTALLDRGLKLNAAGPKKGQIETWS